MRCTLILAALFAATWCDLNADLQNLFKRRCSDLNERSNREVEKQLRINKTVEEKKEAKSAEKQVGEPDAEDEDKKETANQGEKDENGEDPGKDKKEEGGGGKENVSVKYYCALAQVARHAQQFNVTGLVQYYRPMRPFSLPTQDVIRELGKMLTKYAPVAVNANDDHYPFGCDFGVRSYKKLIPRKKNKKKKKKKKQKKRYQTIVEYDAYCVALTNEFVGVLGQIYDGSQAGEIKKILDGLNKQE